MGAAAQSFFDIATDSFRDAEILRKGGGTDKNVVWLLHRTIEMALKAALLAKGLCEEEGKDFKTHRIGELVVKLMDSGFAVAPDLALEIAGHETAPLTGHIPLDEWFGLARRTLACVQSACGFSKSQ